VPPVIIQESNFADAWFNLLIQLAYHGRLVWPRRIQIKEITAVTLQVTDGYNNILAATERNLNHRFMVAEWLWIWFGHNDVATISRYNKEIAKFSDDGLTFAGAYGPWVRGQYPYVFKLLKEDPDSRQAVIQIYRQPVAPSKDVPCTLSAQFLLRAGRIEVIVCMRSSDIWLGLPYDFYNFSMIGNILAGDLGVQLGSVTFHLGSSHLYEQNYDIARVTMDFNDRSYFRSPQLPSRPPRQLDPLQLDWDVDQFIADELRQEPWLTFIKVLGATNRAGALAELRNSYGYGAKNT